MGKLLFIAALAAVLTWVERRWPAGPHLAWWSTARRTDQAWLIIGHGILGPLNNVLFLVAGGLSITLILGHFPHPGEAEIWLGRTTWVSALPKEVSFIIALIAADFLAYWTHRAYHAGFLWRFHAIHHSPTHLDWLAAVRVHPLGNVLGAFLLVVPLALMGFDPRQLAGVGAFIGLSALLVHANVPWDFGPLRFVIASPKFHRWHHADNPAAYGKNLAALFPIWDIWFGTWYLPSHQPIAFGAGMNIPTGFWQHLIWPFRRI